MYTLNFSVFEQYIPQLLEGLKLTLIIVICSMILSFFLGYILAFMRRSSSKTLNSIAGIYVNIIRNTPFLVQLFFLFYGLPVLGIDTKPEVISVLALSINISASNCETLRSGLMAIKANYIEAAEALGMSKFQIIFRVLIPVSFRLSFLALCNNAVGLILTSSVCMSVSTMELMGEIKLVSSRTARPFESYLVILLVYCVLTFAVSIIFKLIGRRITIKL